MYISIDILTYCLKLFVCMCPNHFILKLIRGKDKECHMILKLVTISLPRSPALPFVSSIISSLSTVSSPGRNCILLHAKKI